MMSQYLYYIIYHLNLAVMHFKQSSLALRFLDGPSRNRNGSLHYNHSSLEESPIPTDFREDSDHSPEQYLYPESLQRNRNARRVYDVKQRIVGLLLKLKDWLQELCLTDTCINEVSEQLEPIIDEIKETTEEQSADSCWFSLPYAIENKQNSVLRESNSNITSLAGKHAENNRNHSILIHESCVKSEIMLLSEGEKNLVRLYFKKYCRLLENSLFRINKYSGEKKLKFLLETNIRSIFSETLRMSYDLKLIEFKFREERVTRAANNKNAYIGLLATRIRMILRDKGGIKTAFTTIKTAFFEQKRRDSMLVEEMVGKIGKLCSLFSRNTLHNLQSFTYKWRESACRLKIEEEVSLVDCIRTKVYNILTDLANLGESASDFGTHWRYLIEFALNNICTELFQEEDCFFMDLQEVMNERSAKREKLITLADFLEEGTEDNGGTMEKMSIDRSFLSQLTIQELRACILSGQIYRNQKSEHNLLLIPIKPASGIFFVRLQSENPSSPNLKPPMKLSSFRCLLRVVELITPIIEEIAAICRRVEACWEETQKHEHYSLLLKEFLKNDLSNNQEGHLQLQCKSSEIEIDSNRLESSSETVKDIMERCGISCLMVYHCGKEGINDMPCIAYGNSELAASQRYIIQSIYEELISSGKDLLVINRNGQLFNILPIWVKNERMGLVNYVSSSEKNDNEVVSQCLVPLLLKCEGKMTCEHCQVSLKIPPIHHEECLENYGSQQNLSMLIDFDSSSILATCQTLLQLQAQCSRLLKCKGNFFFKMVYKIDLSDLDTFYSLSSGGEVEWHHLNEKDKLIHKQMFIQDYTSLSYSSPFARLTFEAPCFSNPQLYIYQNQNQYPLRFVAIPLKNNKEHYGYFLSAFYHMDNKTSESYIAYLQKMVECLNMNQFIFMPTKLNDERLQNYCQREQLRDSRQLQKQLFNKIKQPKKGKLAESLLDFSMNLKKCLTEANNGRYQCNIKVLKVNLDTNQINVISSTDNQYGGMRAQKEIIQQLKESNILRTHEKLTSSECRLKKNDHNRTIKPIKAQNLNSIAIFLPILPQCGSHQLLEQIKRKYELRGLIANENLDFLQGINAKLQRQSCKDNHTYALLKIGSSMKRKDMYFVMLQHEIVDPQGKDVINECITSRSLSIFIKIFQQSALYQSSLAQKGKSIQQLNKIIPRKYTIRNSILALKNDWMETKQKITKFYIKLEKYVYNLRSKNVLYFKSLRESFSTIKIQNAGMLMKSRNFFDRILPIVQRLQMEQKKLQGFKGIYAYVEDNSSFNHYRSCIKLTDKFHQKAIYAMKGSFSAIIHMSQLRNYNRQLDRSQSARKIHLLVSKIQRREFYQHFFNQINKIHLHYINSFDLIVQQFQNLQFYSMQSFTAFANERFDAILHHIAYGLVNKIQIGVAQIYQKRLLIYRLNSQRQFSQVTLQKPISLQPQLHNNFNFLPIHTTFSNNNYLIYKISLKETQKNDKQTSIIRKCIMNGIVPCYQRYLQTQLDRADKLCCILLRITCKQMWNSAIDETQGIYAFGKGTNYEEQSSKVRALSAIKHLKRAQLIKELNMIRNAINEETKQYYQLQYEYNAISNAISCGIPSQVNKDDLEIFDRYDDFITKDRLKEQRQVTERLQIEYQKRNLQYQIKSKTFATSKIFMYWDRKDKNDIENTNFSLIMNENMQNLNKNNLNLEKTIVQGKMKLSSNFQKQKTLQKKKKAQSVRSMLLLVNNFAKNYLQKSKKQAFLTISWPRGSRIRA